MTKTCSEHVHLVAGITRIERHLLKIIYALVGLVGLLAGVNYVVHSSWMEYLAYYGLGMICAVITGSVLEGVYRRLRG